MSEIPNIYVSKRCEHCIELIQILQKRDDIKGNFKIVSIDEEPFPKYIKAVPCMVLGKEIWNAEEIFRMLKETINVLIKLSEYNISHYDIKPSNILILD